MQMLIGWLLWRWSKTAPAGSTSSTLKELYRSDVRFVQMLSCVCVEPYVPATLGSEAYSFC